MVDKILLVVTVVLETMQAVEIHVNHAQQGPLQVLLQLLVVHLVLMETMLQEPEIQPVVPALQEHGTTLEDKLDVLTVLQELLPQVLEIPAALIALKVNITLQLGKADVLNVPLEPTIVAPEIPDAQPVKQVSHVTDLVLRQLQEVPVLQGNIQMLVLRKCISGSVLPYAFLKTLFSFYHLKCFLFFS